MHAHGKVTHVFLKRKKDKFVLYFRFNVAILVMELCSKGQPTGSQFLVETLWLFTLNLCNCFTVSKAEI